MHTRTITRAWFICLGVAAFPGVDGLALADVTIEQTTSVDLGITKLSTTATEQYTSDKKHQSSAAHCSGMMSLLCGKTDTGEIVRLDKSVTYRLQPDKKAYREEPFPTEAERHEMQQRMQAAMEKMKAFASQQPAAQKPAVDTSKCQMSPPVFDSKDLGAAGQVLGHDVHRAEFTMTQSCTNPDTGDVCDLQWGFDSWLTDDDIAGFGDRAAFEKAYLTKMGLMGEGGAAMQASVQRMLAPYADQMRQLSAKATALHGHPLRTSFHLAYGGPRCAAASQAAGGGAGQSGGGVPTSLSDVGSKLLVGMFAKKKPADADATASFAPTTPPGMKAMMTVVTETTAVRTDPIPAAQFEVPAGWTLIVPPPGKPVESDSCPPPPK